jgi:hypothetical protein
LRIEELGGAPVLEIYGSTETGAIATRHTAVPVAFTGHHVALAVNGEIKQAAHDVTPNLGGKVKGQVFLIPASIKAGEIARVLREGYDVSRLNDSFQELVKVLALDVRAIQFSERGCQSSLKRVKGFWSTWGFA